MNGPLTKKAEELFSKISQFENCGLAESGDLYQDTFLIAGQVLRIRYGSQRLKEFFRWQMNLFRLALPETPDYTVCIWCSDCMDELYQLLGKGSVSMKLNEDSDPIDIYLGTGPRAGKHLFAWKESEKKGWVIVPPDSLERFIAISFSLSPLFSRMSNALASRMLHCAAVVYEGKAVLISGLSGSGKSTLAAACLNYGMQYISDDTVYFRLKDGMVFPVCSTLHLADNVLEHLPRLYDLVNQGVITTYPGRASKRHLDLSALSESFVNGAPAVMILCPEITDTDKPAFEKTNGMEALIPLLCSSIKLLGIHDNVSAYMKGITEKLKHLPTYRYQVGPDLKQNVEVLLQFLKEKKNVQFE